MPTPGKCIFTRSLALRQSFLRVSGDSSYCHGPQVDGANSPAQSVSINQYTKWTGTTLT